MPTIFNTSDNQSSIPFSIHPRRHRTKHLAVCGAKPIHQQTNPRPDHTRSVNWRQKPRKKLFWIDANRAKYTRVTWPQATPCTAILKATCAEYLHWAPDTLLFCEQMNPKIVSTKSCCNTQSPGKHLSSAHRKLFKKGRQTNMKQFELIQTSILFKYIIPTTMMQKSSWHLLPQAPRSATWANRGQLFAQAARKSSQGPSSAEVDREKPRTKGPGSSDETKFI